MSKIKLLVEIDEEDYGDFCDWFESVPSSVDGLPCVKGKFNTALYDAKPYDDSGDLISRSALKKAIEEVEDNYDGYEPNDLGKFISKVDELIDNAPTVEIPENEVNCVLTMFGKCSYNETGCSDCEIKDKIRKALNERPHNKWQPLPLKTLNGDDIVAYESSFCKAVADKKYQHCPKCLANMEGGNEE